MDDKAIISLYFQRNEQAITETDEKYGKLCYTLAYNILKNNPDSEECVNDTYLSVWNQIPPTKPNNFMAFICKITRNLSLNRLKYNIAQKRTPSSLVSLSELDVSIQDTQDFLEVGYEEIGKKISQFLKAEKADTRNVFIRRYWFLDSIEDISARYSFSESKVKSLLFRTRQKLRIYLEKEGIAL